MSLVSTTDVLSGTVTDPHELAELIDELAERRDEYVAYVNEGEDDDAALVELDDDEEQILAGLADLADEIRGYDTLVPESQWLDFATDSFDELVVGDAEAADRVRPYIDYEAWADALAVDYTSLTIMGHDYYAR
jgi:hypothetical protein